jgi:heavy metal sensor kinase
MCRTFEKNWERILLKLDAGKDTSFMIKSLRLRLQLWHALILATAVLLFGSAFYGQLHRATMGEIDAELLSGAKLLESALKGLPKSTAGELLTKESWLDLEFDWPVRRPPWRPTPPSGVPRPNGPPPKRPPDSRHDQLYFAIYSSDGNLLRTEGSAAGEFVSSDLDWGGTPRSLDYRRINDRREVLLRGSQGYPILVGTGMHHAVRRLTDSLVQLAVIGVSVLALGLVGGWWLAGNAIRPIEEISATAENISATNLSQRIDCASMDEELQSLGTVLNSMLTRLESSFEQQSRFIADASHELRTPISVLLSHCELSLSRSRTVAEYQQTIVTCQSAAERMKVLTDSLLTLARADAGRLELNVTKVDLHVLAGEAVAMFLPFAQERKVAIELTGGAAVCESDAARIQQVIVNLLHNGIIYNQVGGKVNLKTEVVDGWAVLKVQDNGLGIAQDALSQLFDRFYRVDESRTRSQGGHENGSLQVGSGLGLAICKSIVDAHDGSLAVTSQIDTGSMFEMKLPVQSRGAT